MRIRKLNSVDVKLHDLTKVKLKTAGNTSVVQFTAGNNKTCTVRNLSKDTYLDVKTGEVRKKKKSESRYQSPKSVRKSNNRLMDLIRCNTTDFYDGFGRLEQVTKADGSFQKNHYDAEGLRAEMEENGQLVKFLYNENREAAAEEESDGNVIRYIRGLGLISSDSEKAKTYYHYVSDEQGSITHVINGKEKESGELPQEDVQSRVLNHYEYDAFGNTIRCEEQVENRFCYQGEQYDPITRQYYLRARYYNPVIGRFIQEDTYYGDGLNLYEYCRNNTITYKDPTGHKVCPAQKNLYAKYREEGMNAQDVFNRMRKELGFVKEDRYSSLGQMSKEDGEAYTRFWEQVESGEPRWGERPNAEMLYEKNYIENHVRNFENGGSYLVSKKVYDLRIKDNILNPQLGRPGELFISTH